MWLTVGNAPTPWLHSPEHRLPAGLLPPNTLPKALIKLAEQPPEHIGGSADLGDGLFPCHLHSGLPRMAPGILSRNKALRIPTRQMLGKQLMLCSALSTHVSIESCLGVASLEASRHHMYAALPVG